MAGSEGAKFHVSQIAAALQWHTVVASMNRVREQITLPGFLWTNGAVPMTA